MNTVKNIICFLLILVAVCAAAFYVAKENLPSDLAVAIQPIQLRSVIAASEQRYQRTVDSLSSSNQSLRAQSRKVNTQLENAKYDNKILQLLVADLVVEANMLTDTQSRLLACDSLRSAASALLQSATYKDSLYDCSIGALQAIVSNRDSCIAVQDQIHSALRVAFTTCTVQQEMLHAQVNMAENRLKRFRIKSKLLSAGAMLAAGIATYSLIKH